MKPITLCAVILLTGLAIQPAKAQDAAQTSADDIFNNAESVIQTDTQTQNAAPRDAVLKEAVPRLTGTFTSSVGATWSWGDAWGSTYSLDQQGTGISLGFVARPDSDISVSAEVHSLYPFVQQITSGTSTYTVPNFTIWSLYSKFHWRDSLFFAFGKQPIKWGTGYFFSPADDVFAQSSVDVNNPTADREGPLALKVQYPIPGTMHNLYLFAALPRSSNAAALAGMIPEDIAVAGKAEFLIGNTELAAAGYYQRNQRPQAIMMGTTGLGGFNIFAEGLAAFPSPESDPFIEKVSSAVTWGAFNSSAYSVVDRSGDTIFSGTGGVMYSDLDLSLTIVAQYLYNGRGYDTLTLNDITQAMTDRMLSQPSGEPTLDAATLMSGFAGLGRVGRHYALLSASLSSLFGTTLSASVLALANLSDASGYVSPTLSFTAVNYVKISGGARFSWGASGAELSNPNLALMLTASIGSVSF